MDFGMDLNFGNKKNKRNKDGLQEPVQHMRGVSMDPSSSPFFMAGPTPGKTFSDSDSILEDRYRAVPGVGSRSGSRSNSPMPRRAATGDSNSTLAPSYRHDVEAKLLHNAQGNPMSGPPRGDFASRFAKDGKQLPSFEKPLPAPEPAKLNDSLAAPKHDATRDSYFEKNAKAIRKSNNYLQAFFQSSPITEWDEKAEPSSPPSSHNVSATSTVIDSNSTHGTKTPMTSVSETDSLPLMHPNKQMDWHSPIVSPSAETSDYTFDKLRSQAASPDLGQSINGRKPLRLGMPATEDPVRPLPHPSAERKVSTLSEHSKHKSFDASLHNYHISVMSNATSNLTDILQTPRDSSMDPPPVPQIPNASRDQMMSAKMHFNNEYDDPTPRNRTPEYQMEDDDYYGSVPPRGHSLAANMTIDDEYDAEPQRNEHESERMYMDHTVDSAPPRGHSPTVEMPMDDEYSHIPPRGQSQLAAMPMDDEYNHIPPRGQSQLAVMPTDDEYSHIPPRGQSQLAAMPIDHDEAEAEEYNTEMLGVDGYDMPDNRRMSVLMRPLPHEDPNENPEERANRIRSFYKEYFDDSQPYTSQVPLPNQAEYYEDYDSEYLGDGTLYDAERGGFVVAAPYAEPVTRRAMTPPPRGPPRFDPRLDQGYEYRGRSRAGSSAAQFPPRGQSATGAYGPPRGQSAMGNYGPPRGPSAMSNYPPRGQSSMGNYGPPRGPSAMSNRSRGPPRRPMPPPQPLTSLPTPAKLKDDAAIYTAADFAPPVSFRDRQNGRRPDSPMGAQRPYSPSVRAFVPLNSSFDDLGAIPSPYVPMISLIIKVANLYNHRHMLRKSGTFTSLDFAPPPRFRNVDAGSDASSIRSGRSGISTQQIANMRAGAYRISRIPKGLAGTKTDIMSGLKPTWDLRGPA
jgi:hypothetical protein